MDETLKQLLQQKCIIGDCNERQGIYLGIPTPNGYSETVPFCMEHGMKFMEMGQKWEKTARKIQSIMEHSDGSMIIIHTWSELVRKLKPEFLEMATQGLELTKGLCLECGRPAFGVRAMFQPVCGECYGFPRNVLRCALK